MLTERQREVLRIAVAIYVETGKPVSSKLIAAWEGVSWGSSTVRAELAELERGGYLTHPHTSAGRVPTEAGYRDYARGLLSEAPTAPLAPPALVGLSRVRREVDEALRETTAELARITDLVALVTAPPAVFTDLQADADGTLYMEGATRLLAERGSTAIIEAEGVVHALERRVGVLSALRSMLGAHSVFVWIGAENPQPELRSVSVVGANYGLGYRNLGSVGVIGPLRMDYANAIASVREAAGVLSRFVETVYHA